MKSCTIIPTDIENIGKYCLRRISDGYIIAKVIINGNEVFSIRSYAGKRVLTGETDEKYIICSEFYPHPESIGDSVSFSFNVKTVEKIKISDSEKHFNSLFAAKIFNQTELWVESTESSMFASGPREFWAVQNICEEIYESGLLSGTTNKV